MKKIRLKPYQKICPKCLGKKSWNPCWEFGNSIIHYKCSFCKDKKIIDWIDEIKNEKFKTI